MRQLLSSILILASAQTATLSLNASCIASSRVTPTFAYNGDAEDMFAFLLDNENRCPPGALVMKKSALGTEIGCITQSNGDPATCGSGCNVRIPWWIDPKPLGEQDCQGPDWLKVDLNAVKERFLGQKNTACYDALYFGNTDLTVCEQDLYPTTQPLGHVCLDASTAIGSTSTSATGANIWSAVLHAKATGLCAANAEIAVKQDAVTTTIGCVSDDTQIGTNCSGTCPTNADYYFDEASLQSYRCMDTDFVLVDFSNIWQSHAGYHNLSCYDALSTDTQADIDTYCGTNPFGLTSTTSIGPGLDEGCVTNLGLQGNLQVFNNSEHIWGLALLVDTNCPVVGVNVDARGIAIAGCLGDPAQVSTDCTGACPTDSRYIKSAAMFEQYGCEGTGFRTFNREVLRDSYHHGSKTSNCYTALNSGDNDALRAVCGEPLSTTFTTTPDPNESTTTGAGGGGGIGGGAVAGIVSSAGLAGILGFLLCGYCFAAKGGEEEDDEPAFDEEAFDEEVSGFGDDAVDGAALLGAGVAGGAAGAAAGAAGGAGDGSDGAGGVGGAGAGGVGGAGAGGADDGSIDSQGRRKSNYEYPPSGPFEIYYPPAQPQIAYPDK
ncbi:MAG: hypothetical protein KVP17_002399 [Porospora cf. gigantea B]|uniref:uncharacterized protein n=1 Tax=Porospora cf. gigantea B TaxID=2853592 RepID=UPI003571E1FB|nr:MAG: hypothetical protein KVP17_002399 [Porospora cf. gigantea B]